MTLTITGKTIITGVVKLESALPASTVWDTVAADAATFVFTNGDLTVTRDVTPAARVIRSVGSVSSGKHYTEFTLDVVNGTHIPGIVTVNHEFGGVGAWPGSDVEGYGYSSIQGFKFRSSVPFNYGTPVVVNDIVGMALDLDNGAIWFSVNGTWQDNNGAGAGIVSADIAAYNATAIAGAAFTGVTGTYFVGGSANVLGDQFTTNFGSSAFNSTPPTGFTGWS